MADQMIEFFGGVETENNFMKNIKEVIEEVRI
jgi:hypothetical protein